jgi:hypothetical protein
MPNKEARELAKSMLRSFGPGALDQARKSAKAAERQRDARNHALWLEVMALISEHSAG